MGVKKGLHGTGAKSFMIESQRHSYHLGDPSLTISVSRKESSWLSFCVATSTSFSSLFWCKVQSALLGGHFAANVPTQGGGYRPSEVTSFHFPFGLSVVACVFGSWANGPIWVCIKLPAVYTPLFPLHGAANLKGFSSLKPGKCLLSTKNVPSMVTTIVASIDCVVFNTLDGEGVCISLLLHVPLKFQAHVSGEQLKEHGDSECSWCNFIFQSQCMSSCPTFYEKFLKWDALWMCSKISAGCW